MAQYKDGTVDVQNGSQLVVGTGTKWVANVVAGHMFSRQASGVPYFVGNVIDDTHLSLSAVYVGSTESSVPYSITRDFTPRKNLPYIEKGDVDTDLIFKRFALLVDQLLP